MLAVCKLEKLFGRRPKYKPIELEPKQRVCKRRLSEGCTSGNDELEKIEQLGLQDCVSLLRGCDSLAEGERVHASLIRSGHWRNRFVRNVVMSMYAKLGSLGKARAVFDAALDWDVASWNIMVAAYARHGFSKEALLLFREMQRCNLRPNKITLISLLSSCSSLSEGKLAHGCAILFGLASDVVVGTALVKMYSNCGHITQAFTAFNKIHNRNKISWSAIITAFAHHGHFQESLHLFRQMQQEGMKPDSIHFVCVLGACTNMAEGKFIHARIVDAGLGLNNVVATALVTMYGKCGSLEDARRVFDGIHQQDVVSWTAILTAYAQNGEGKRAIQTFREMQQDGVEPNIITLVSLLDAYTSLATSLAEGKLVHAFILDLGFESNLVVATALVNVYGKLGSLKNAQTVFCKMHQQNVVSWNAMIGAYAHHGQCTKALQQYRQMKFEGIKPDGATFATILGACANQTILEEGKSIHASIVEAGLESNSVVATALIDMYGKCGSIEDSRAVFDKLHQHDKISWNAMIATYAQHGHGKEALQLFQCMEQEGIVPDGITFVSILSACSHAGLVNEGHWYFVSMLEDYFIRPTKEHYGCMIALLGRSGYLEKAENIIKQMPIEPSAILWEIFLGACGIHGNLDQAKQAAECVLKLDSLRVLPYSCLQISRQQ